MGFPGVIVSAEIQSTEVILEGEAFGEDNYIQVLTDRREPQCHRLETGPFSIKLAEQLDRGTPTHLKVVRRTESWQGTLRVDALLADEFLEPEPLPNRRLLFIGDSITCGASADRLGPDYVDGAITSNAYHSFGMELGRRLNAQVHLASYGGRGLLRDWQGLTDAETNNLRPIFERSLPDDPQALWDHTIYTPNAVIFGLGTNDFNIGIPDQNVWTEAYRDFVLRVLEVHPNALIVLMNSPMLGIQPDPGNFARGAALKWYAVRTQQLLKEALDNKPIDTRARVVVGEHRPTVGSPGDAHPVATEHLGMADDLEPILRANLDW